VARLPRSQLGVRADSLGALTGELNESGWKHAVHGLTKSVAVLYGPKGIRANAVAPVAVKTNIEAPFKPEWAQERLGPLMAVVPTLAEAEELAASITWLASSDASNVNGVILPVDGGWAAI